jgi:hypothetical protein
MAIVPQQGLPFVVESPSLERVQLWASYVGRISEQPLIQSGFNVMSDVFTAFWWQAAAVDSYQKAMPLLGMNEYVSSVVFYLDMIVSELGRVAQYWGRVVSLMNELPGLCLSSSQWIGDAMQGVQSAVDLRLHVAMQVVGWCDQYQMATPEHTQAYFTELWTKGL